MQPYMIDTSHPEIYKRAFKESLDNFRKKSLLEMVKNSGAKFFPDESELRIVSLGQTLRIRYPEGEVFFNDGIHKPIWSWRLTVLNYLSRADGIDLQDRLITYKELENGNVYYPAFYRDSILPLKQLADKDDYLLEKSCKRFAADVKHKNYFEAVFYYLPRFPVYIRLWAGDDEVPGSANILFDTSANHYLHTEDVAVAGDIMVRFLLANEKTTMV